MNNMEKDEDLEIVKSLLLRSMLCLGSIFYYQELMISHNIIPAYIYKSSPV